MHKLYVAANVPEAYIVLNMLARAGIEARVLNEHAAGGMGELPFTHTYPEVWIDEDADRKLAARILADYQQRPPATGSVRCRQCNAENPGDFEICWQCGGAVSG
ncbi:MAG: DUF2007 domain-containing protein [Gammaproteobacteria bacterium]|nr:DUF2007 domain-containing protein [Gammaproteobacteria bacterium]